MGKIFILELRKHGYIDNNQSFKISKNIPENELRTFYISDIKSLVLTEIVVNKEEKESEVVVEDNSGYLIAFKRFLNGGKGSV